MTNCDTGTDGNQFKASREGDQTPLFLLFVRGRDYVEEWLPGFAAGFVADNDRIHPAHFFVAARTFLHVVRVIHRTFPEPGILGEELCRQVTGNEIKSSRKLDWKKCLR